MMKSNRVSSKRISTTTESKNNKLGQALNDNDLVIFEKN
jgi:hypothetical protein